VIYLKSLDSGAVVDALMTAPEAEGQIAYNAAMDGFNFLRNRLPLSEIAAQVLRYAQFPRRRRLRRKGALIRDCLPGFARGKTPSDCSARPYRRASGSETGVTTPTHVDEWNNVACGGGGRRRFTLFPPEQIANLYVGPLDFAPTGAAMSMVNLA